MASLVALNGRFSGTLQPTGTQTAAFHLFDAVIRHPERRLPLVIFADPRFPGVAAWSEIRATRLIPVPFSRWSRGRAQVWEQFVLPRSAGEAGARIVHHPMTTSPAWGRGLRSIVTLHDLNWCLHPEWYSPSFRAVYRVTALPGLRSADMVVAVSDYVRTRAQEQFPEAVLRRVYNGVKPLSPRPTGGREGPPYALCVGSLQPHKNLARIVQAFESVATDWPDLELWVVGRKQPRFRSGHDARLNHPRIKVLGYLSDEDLFNAYANAAVFCYPSIEEGFGLPILEAMQAGVPVITSNTSCLPEIAGNSAELVDPCAPGSIAGAIKKILSFTSAERAHVITSGKERARQFSWEKAATAYLDLYRELSE